MTTRRGRGSGDATPPGADDFGRIHGIGVAIKKRLYSAGIHTFADLAELSPDTIAARVGDFPAKSVELIEDWIVQARELASIAHKDSEMDASSLAEPQFDEASPIVRLHPETFTVELQLHEDNGVHHTRVTHHQSKDKDSWASWEETRLVDFIVEHAALRLPLVEPDAPVAAPVEPVPEPAFEPAVPIEPDAPVAAPVEPVPEPAFELPPVEPATLADAPVEPAFEPPPVEPATLADAPVEPAFESPPVEPVSQPAVGVPRLHALEAVPAESDEPSRFLRHEQPFGIRLTFDLANAAVPSTMPFGYTASIYATSVSNRSRQTVGEASGTITPADTVIINVEGKGLPAGMYRLEATVALTTASAASSRSAPVAMIKSNMLQVY